MACGTRLILPFKIASDFWNGRRFPHGVEKPLGYAVFAHMMYIVENGGAHIVCVADDVRGFFNKEKKMETTE